jgi:hypothetical protein
MNHRQYNKKTARVCFLSGNITRVVFLAGKPHETASCFAESEIGFNDVQPIDHQIIYGFSMIFATLLSQM